MRKNRSTRRSAPRHPTTMASTAKPPDPIPCALVAALLPGLRAFGCRARKGWFSGHLGERPPTVCVVGAWAVRGVRTLSGKPNPSPWPVSWLYARNRCTGLGPGYSSRPRTTAAHNAGPCHGCLRTRVDTRHPRTPRAAAPRRLPRPTKGKIPTQPASGSKWPTGRHTRATLASLTQLINSLLSHSKHTVHELPLLTQYP